MTKTINSDLIRGNINTIILKALYDGDRYGYDIIKEIEIKSHGQYILKQPTLYSCLKRLETQGFIEAYWGEQSSNGGRRKYYRLTDSGKEIFKQSQDEYEYSRTVIDNLISDTQYDLSTLTPIQNTETEENKENDNENEELVETIETQEKIKEEVAQTLVAVEEVKEEENLVPLVEIQENSYVSPAPTFTEEINKETETPVEQTIDQPQINNSDYINSMLNQNFNSYFERTSDTELVATKNNQEKNDTDEIEKRLAALKASYNQEIEEYEESNENENTASEASLLSYDNGFYKYNTPHAGITSNEKDKRGHRSLSSLIKTDTSIAINSEPKTISVKEQIKTRNFGKLSQSLEELGENAKIRAHYDTKHDYKKQYYFRDSLLRMYHYGIMFIIMLAEIFCLYVVGKLFFNANTSYDIPLYIGSIVVAFLFPAVAAALFIAYPNSRKRNEYNIKTAMIVRFIISIQLIIIIYGLNLWMEMPPTFDSQYFITLTIPAVFAINLPFSAIIFNSLRKKSKFAFKD